jgi:hypothetical protein
LLVPEREFSQEGAALCPQAFKFLGGCGNLNGHFAAYVTSCSVLTQA